MGKENKGQPSGTNKSEGTGMPSDFEKMENDKELTDKYTENDQEIAENVRSNNPNRNVDKTDATNAGGYKT